MIEWSDYTFSNAYLSRVLELSRPSPILFTTPLLIGWCERIVILETQQREKINLVQKSNQGG